MEALRAIWQVTAGLIPGEPMPEASKDWNYTASDYKEDGHKRGAKFEVMQREAQAHAAALWTGGYNWVSVQYLWI